MLDFQFGVLQPVIEFFTGKPVPVFKNPYWVMPTVAAVTIWWTNGFNVLLFIAGLRNISKDFYEAAQLDGATRRQLFTRVYLASSLACHWLGIDPSADTAVEDL